MASASSNNPNPYYQGDSDDEETPPTPTDANGNHIYDKGDPERQERIRQMVQASSAHNVLEDEQVTDFVMRMAEKNQNNVQQQPQQQQGGGIHDPPRYTISDSSEDDDGSDLDASYNNHKVNQHKKRLHRGPPGNGNGTASTSASQTPDDYPPGEAYAGDEAEIPSYDPKEDDAISYSRLCCVACALVIGMIATSVLILVFVVIADGEDGTSSHHGSGFDGMVLPFAPSNLKNLCQPDNLKTFQGVLDCREPCMRAACCWEKGERGQQPVCWESHPLECAPYESCINLLEAGSEPRPGGNGGRPTSSVPRAPEGVKSCKADTINSVDQVLLCENACRLGECCWKTGSGSNQQCHTDPNCDDYKPCHILNQGGSAGSGSSQAVPSTSSASNIPTAPINLKEVCSQQSVTACEEACVKATCCWKLATHTYEGPLGETITESVLGSCSHEDVCDGYKPCKDLPNKGSGSSGSGQSSPSTPAANSNTNFQTVTIPAAPSNLADTCTASLEGECATQCYKAPCCWQLQTHAFTGPLGEIVTESVLGACSHRSECAGYAPCKALPKQAKPGTTPAPTAAPVAVPQQQQTNLEAVCSASLEGVCTDTCNQAQCCWKLASSTYTGPLGETVQESVMGTCAHLAECKAYEPCKQLPEATMSHVHDIVPAPTDLAQTCATAQDGACRNTCNQATCCWKLAITTMEGPHGSTITESVLGSCSHSHQLECQGYEPCKKLPEATHPPPETVPTAHLNIPTAPATLATTCAATTPTTDNMDSLHLCKEYCNAATCCWKKETHTFKGSSGETITESQQGSCADQAECNAYKPCSILDSDVFSPHTPAIDPTPAPAPGQSPPTSKPPFSSTTEYTEEVIFDVCYNHEGTRLCEQVCDPGSCCYKADETCPNDGSVNCGKYEPCKILLQADGNGVQSEVEKACSDLTDLAPCVQQCSKGTCCFTQDFGKTCDVAAPSTVCTDFTPCEVLYRGSNNP